MKQILQARDGGSLCLLSSSVVKGMEEVSRDIKKGEVSIFSENRCGIKGGEE